MKIIIFRKETIFEKFSFIKNLNLFPKLIKYSILLIFYINLNLFIVS